MDEEWFLHVRPEPSRERVPGIGVDKGFSKEMKQALKSYDGCYGGNNDFIGAHRYQTDLIIESNEELAKREPDCKQIG